MLHLPERYQGLRPRDASARARAITWMFAALNTIEPPVMELSLARIRERNERWYEQRLPVLEERVRKRLGELCRALVLMGIEIRRFLVIDAFSRFPGMALARSADLPLAFATQLLDSTAAGSGCGRGPTGPTSRPAPGAPSEPACHPRNYAVPHPRQQVIDRVRVDEANRLRTDPHARRLVKGSRWLLVRNRENVTREADQVRLRERLTAHRALMITYVLKDDLKVLWNYRHEGYARRFWKGWYRRAMRSRIEPLKAFARKLRAYLPGAAGALPLSSARQRARGHQQQDQGHQAHGLRVP